MTNAFSLFKSLIIYGICLPLAIFVGYLLATPEDLTTYGALGLLLVLMSVPLFLRFHYPWLIFCWNSSAGLYFLPGRPSFCLMMIFISFGFSFLAYVMNRDLKFISVPWVARPLLLFAGVVIGTAYFTGGIGLNALGSEVSGGKRYIFLLSGVVGYFALTAVRIPVRKAALYVNLFFIGFVITAIGNILYLLSPALYFLAYLFPQDAATNTGLIETGSGITRLGSLATACVGIVYLLLARYGIIGILDVRKAWRILLVIALAVTSLFGGYRSKVIELAAAFAVLFYFEGLFRSRLLPAVLLAGVLGLALVLPFASKLPLTVQRSLTFLPLKLDVEAELNAQASTDWRLAIWSEVLPTVPQYLLMGKGLAMDMRDLEMMRSASFNRGPDSTSGAGATLAGDYHNGPLSIIIPFGLGGTITFLWFLGAGFRALQLNNRYGNPDFARYNRFLLAYFIVKVLMFMFVFGSLYSDVVFFTGPVGLSIALNGGVLGPALQPAARPAMSRFKLANAAR